MARMPANMADVRTIEIELTEEQIADLQAAVDAGAYATTADAVQHAISDWQVRPTLTDADVQRLGAVWEEGRGEHGRTRVRRRADFGIGTSPEVPFRGQVTHIVITNNHAGRA